MKSKGSKRHRARAVAAAIVLALLAPWQGGVLSREEGVEADPLEALLDHEAFQGWLMEVRAEASARGISDATLDRALGDIKPVTRVIELDRRQPEFTEDFGTYLGRRVNDERRARGRTILARHRALLSRIQAEYGVPPRYLVALWGLETSFGENTGNYRVIDALATLAYDRRRARFFRAELLSALRIFEEGHTTPDEMIGSWSGATGQMQFMPSTFIRHAVDYTGDGRKDIWGSLPDAFASAANFLSRMGWRPGETWGRAVRLPDDFDTTLATLDRKLSLKEWAALGVRRIDGSALPHAGMKGSIVLPQGRDGPAFLVYDNFRVIMRWNRSINFALSVCHLADRIVEMP